MQRKTKDTTLGAQESRPGVDLSPLPPVSPLSAIRIFEKRTFMSDPQRSFIQNCPYFTCSHPVSYHYLGIMQISMQQNTWSQESTNFVDLPLPPVTLLSAIKIFEKSTFISEYQGTFIQNSPYFTYSQSVSYHYLRNTQNYHYLGIMQNLHTLSAKTLAERTLAVKNLDMKYICSLSPVSPLSAVKIFEKSTFISDQQMYLHKEYSYFTYLRPTSILPLSRKVQICSQSVNYHYLGNAQITQAISNLPLSRNYVELVVQAISNLYCH